MFGIMGTQWKFTKGIRELVIIAEKHGVFKPEGREQMIKNALELSRDLKMASTRLGAHEQAMITIMTFVGSMGPIAFNDAVSWCNEYAGQHGVTSAVEGCKETAADFVKRMG